MFSSYRYLDELQSYLGGMLYLKEAIITLLFWRGHHAVKVAGKKYLLPLHSAFLFLIGITVVEYPQLFPSFCFLSTAWSLLASMLFRRHHPNPWMRCKGFIDIFFALLLGDSFPPATIVSNENRDEVLEYMGYWKLKAENEAKAAELAQQEALDEAEEAEQALDAIGDTDTDITTKKGSFIPVSVDPFKKYMEPVQAYLVIACRLLRYVRNIFLWEECYLSFWLAIGSLALSVVCVFVPWFFLIKWTSRVLVWTLCGPWMKLVDIYFYTPMENMTEEEIAEQKLKAKELKKKYLAEAVERARIARERTKKLKTMKKYLFGKFIMKVPVLKDDRYVDFPLPESSAVPYTAKPLALAELAMKEAGYHRVRVPGQNLDGDMIPSVSFVTLILRSSNPPFLTIHSPCYFSRWNRERLPRRQLAKRQRSMLRPRATRLPTPRLVLLLREQR
jgi:signal transduction histidine kinase